MPSIDENRRGRGGLRTSMGPKWWPSRAANVIAAAALVPVFGAGCSSTRDEPPSPSVASAASAATASAATAGTCSISGGDGSGPSVYTYQLDAHAVVTITTGKSPDGFPSIVLEYDFDKQRMGVVEIVNHDDGSADLTETFEPSAMVSKKGSKATLHASSSKEVKGDIDGHDIVPFEMAGLKPDFVPQLADKSPLPKIDDEIQKELNATLTAIGNSGDGKGGTTCSGGGQAAKVASPSRLHTAWMPGLPDGPGPGCGACIDSCTDVGISCISVAAVGCIAFAVIPYFGWALMLLCDGAAAGACLAADVVCLGACANIGSACCPVACGVACCGPSETCLDTGLGLCCRAGFTACPGPNEVCFNPRTERCQPDGSACALTQVCGAAGCCANGSHCFDANAGTCCGDSQACGSVCCGAGQACVNSPTAGQACCPAERACGTTCCGTGQFCDTTTNTCHTAATCAPGSWACEGNSTSVCCLNRQRCANHADGTPFCVN